MGRGDVGLALRNHGRRLILTAHRGQRRTRRLPLLTIPAWGIGVLVTLVIAVLTFAWRLAVKAEKSADKLDAATTRLQALEGRIAVIATIETALALTRQEVSHLTTRFDDATREIASLRESRHKAASDITRLEAALAETRKTAERAHDEARASHHPH